MFFTGLRRVDIGWTFGVYNEAKILNILLFTAPDILYTVVCIWAIHHMNWELDVLMLNVIYNQV